MISRLVLGEVVKRRQTDKQTNKRLVKYNLLSGGYKLILQNKLGTC